MNKIFIYSIIIIIIIFGVVWMSYGTLHPCGILKKEVKPIIREMASEETGGFSLFVMALIDPFIDDIIDDLSPVECLKQVISIKITDKETAMKKIMDYIESANLY